MYFDINFNFNLSYMNNYTIQLLSNAFNNFIYSIYNSNLELNYLINLMFKGIILSFIYSLMLSLKSFFLVFTFI